jgi:hypothetical protein
MLRANDKSPHTFGAILKLIVNDYIVVIVGYLTLLHSFDLNLKNAYKYLLERSLSLSEMGFQKYIET